MITQSCMLTMLSCTYINSRWIIVFPRQLCNCYVFKKIFENKIVRELICSYTRCSMVRHRNLSINIVIISTYKCCTLFVPIFLRLEINIVIIDCKNSFFLGINIFSIDCRNRCFFSELITRFSVTVISPKSDNWLCIRKRKI